MRLHTAELGELDAAFDIAERSDPGRFDLTIASAGGSPRNPNSRNPDYTNLIEVLLSRIAHMGGQIEDAVVTSRQVAHLPVDERRINLDGRSYPFAISQAEDFVLLRKHLTRPQNDIGTTRTKAGGNRRKRMTITLRVSPSIDRPELLRQLGVCESYRDPRGTGATLGLTSAHIERAVNYWKKVGREAFLSEFPLPEPSRYVLLDEDSEIDAEALILAAQAMAGLEPEGRPRDDRIGLAPVLRGLGFGVEDLDRPGEAPFGDNPVDYVDLAMRLGGTDLAIKRIGRREQGFLRGSLGIGSAEPRATARCGMCGRTLPLNLVVAAHIKPRFTCTDEERLDMPHIGWVLCLLGCDAIFERGYVVVDDTGHTIRGCVKPDEPEALLEFIASISGSVSQAWTPERAGYFEAHRLHHAS